MILEKQLFELKEEFRQLSEFLKESSYEDITLESNDDFQRLLDFRFRKIYSHIASINAILDKKQISKIDFKRCKNHLIGVSESRKATGQGNSSDNIKSYILVCIENFKPKTQDNLISFRAIILELIKVISRYNSIAIESGNKEFSLKENDFKQLLSSDIFSSIKKLSLESVLVDFSAQLNKILNS